MDGWNENQFGVFHFQGDAYTLTKQPEPRDRYSYKAEATDQTGNRVQVVWNITKEWDQALEAGSTGEDDRNGILDDESNACDWANPHHIIKS